jgi:hypothetical protein
MFGVGVGPNQAKNRENQVFIVRFEKKWVIYLKVSKTKHKCRICLKINKLISHLAVSQNFLI